MCDGFISSSTTVESPFGWNLNPTEYQLGDQDMEINIGMSPKFEMRPNPVTPSVRDIETSFPSGKTTDLSIQLAPKGTTKLRVK